MSRLNTIALISGGKDSFFSILHCLAQGHKVIALANLYPEDTRDEDTDSYMYQTIGHNIIPLYAAALNLPLYRAPIKGAAVNTAQTYELPPEPDGEHADETESLLLLLREVMIKHPTANAVSTGAILSTYQRTRVESVASRLHLTSLSFLWQYPYLPPYSQSSLLQDMAAVGQDARIIKVASGGLDDRHLWINVADTSAISKLGKDMARFGAGEVGAVLGEGGEYETLSLDGPDILWSSKLVIADIDRETKIAAGGSAVVVIKRSEVVRKPDCASTGLDKLRQPDLWDTEFSTLLSTMTSSTGLTDISAPANNADQTGLVFELMPSVKHSVPGVYTLSNITSMVSQSVSAQAVGIVEEIQGFLITYNLKATTISNTTILLRHMADFSKVNEAYARLFAVPNPPARVTVACGERLPPGVEVMMSVIVQDCNATQRHALHVQSRSYWAPANIGPYSQAVSVPSPASGSDDFSSDIVYVAGQIPLVPATMEILSDDFAEQAVLSLQHLWRIGRSMGVQHWTDAVIYITATSKAQAQKRAMTAAEIWHRIHAAPEEDMSENSDDDDFDVGDRSLKQPWYQSAANEKSYDNSSRAALPDWSVLKAAAQATNQQRLLKPPTCMIVQVSGLPREAQIEWSSVGRRYRQENMKSFDPRSHVNHDIESIMMIDSWQGFLSHAQADTEAFHEIYASTPPPDEVVPHLKAMVVPCMSIFDASGIEHLAALRVRH